MASGLKWLVTGGGGQIGSALVRLAEGKGIEVAAPGREALDLTNTKQIEEVVRAQHWDAVINCAAFTAVDAAESNSEIADLVNAKAPAVLALETARLSIPIIQVSTDYVFDGTKQEPYEEDDACNPLGAYGRSKEAGESAVRTANPQHAIIRTAWVVSHGPKNFVDTMLRLSTERKVLNVVSDQLGCPTSAEDVAAALLEITFNLAGRSGTWHAVNRGQASWFTLALYIFSNLAKRGIPTPQVNAIETKDYPTPAQRPANSRLAIHKIATDFDLSLPHWHDGIDTILKKIFDH